MELVIVKAQIRRVAPDHAGLDGATQLPLRRRRIGDAIDLGEARLVRPEIILVLGIDGKPLAEAMLDARHDATQFVCLVARQKVVGDGVTRVERITDVVAAGGYRLIAQQCPATDAAIAVGHLGRAIDGVGELPRAAHAAAVVEVDIAGARQRGLPEGINRRRVAEDARELDGGVGAGSVLIVLRIIDVELLDAGGQQEALGEEECEVRPGLRLVHVTPGNQLVAIDIQRHPLGELQIALEAQFMTILRHLLVKGGEPPLLVGIAQLEVALGAGNDIAGVKTAQHAIGHGLIAVTSRNARLSDGEAAVNRLREAETRPLGHRHLALEEGLFGLVELDVGTGQRLVGRACAFQRAGDTHPHMIAQPLLRTAAIDIAINVARRGHEFIGHDEILVIAAQRPVTHQVAGIDAG